MAHGVIKKQKWGQACDLRFSFNTISQVGHGGKVRGQAGGKVRGQAYDFAILMVKFPLSDVAIV